MTRAYALPALLTIVLATAVAMSTVSMAADQAPRAGEAHAAAPAVEAKAEAPKVDTTKGGAIAQAVCSACHAADGNAIGNTFPKLAGQHEAYLVKQLHNYKVEGGAKEALRPNPIMAPYAAALGPNDIRNVAAYYATQTYKPATAKTKATVELGEKIWRGGIADKGVPACAGCHSPNGAGIPNQYPRLAGQWGEYNEAQLTAFKGGVRKNNVAMQAIASRLSEAEIKAVSDYAAGLR